MPRLKRVVYANSPQEVVLANDLAKRYKTRYLSIPQIQAELGVSYGTAKKWLADVTFYQICGGRKFSVEDVAKRLAEAQRIGG